MKWISRIVALVFGGVFVFAGVLKLRDPGLFLIDIRSFDMLRDPWAAWLALGLPWLEVFAGMAVITGVLRRGGLLLLNLSLVVFFVAASVAKSRGLNIQCGCFGELESTFSYTKLFVRDAALLATGIVLMWMNRSRRATLVS